MLLQSMVTLKQTRALSYLSQTSNMVRVDNATVKKNDCPETLPYLECKENAWEQQQQTEKR